MNAIFKILKIISWIWITIFIVPGIYIGIWGELSTMIQMIACSVPAIIFLVWRNKEEKPIRKEIKRVKREAIEEATIISDEKTSNNSYSAIKIKELKELKELLDDGVITQEEFDKKKSDLLN